MMGPKQSEEMWQRWADAQRATWEGWTKMVTEGGTGPFSAEMMKQWQSLMTQGLSGSMPGMGDVTRQTAEQLVSSQSEMVKFLEMINQAWQQMQGATDWQQALGQYMEQMRTPWTAASPAFGDDPQKLWQTYLGQWQALGKQWGIDGLDSTNFGDTGWNAYEQTIGKWLNSPNLGLNREFNEKVQLGFDAWVGLQRVQNTYQEKVDALWSEAFQRFMQSLMERQEKEEPIESMRELMLSWTGVAEDIFSQGFQTEEYIQIQSELLNAQMAYRLKQRSIMELFLKAFDLPTRDELDETHRRIYELRKEVKALKKELAGMKPKPRRRPRQKKTE